MLPIILSPMVLSSIAALIAAVATVLQEQRRRT